MALKCGNTGCKEYTTSGRGGHNCRGWVANRPHKCGFVEAPAPPQGSPSNSSDLVMPSSFVTAEMVDFARVEDSWHFATNLNAMMQHGYCTKCGLTPAGCKREGCGA